jgi:ABC-type multidrug transport system fused ATPase/permease subunit
LRKIATLIGRQHLPAWAILAASSVVVGILELIGALLIFALISAILSPATQISLPVLGDLRDLFGGGDRRDFLVALGSTVAIFSVVRTAVFLAQTYLQQRLAQNAAVRLSSRLFGSYLRMPYQLHLVRNSADLLRNVNQSVMEIALYGFVPLVTIASEALLGLGLVVALIVTSPVTTGGMLLLIVPIVYLLLRFTKKAFNRLGVTAHEASAISIRYSQESLHGIRDIKTLGREGFFEDLFNTNRATLARALYTRSVMTEIPRAVVEGLFMVALSSLLVLGVVNGSSQEAVASLGLIAYAGVRLMPSLNRIVGNLNNLQYGTAAIDAVYNELAEIESVDQGILDPAEAIGLERELRVSNVGFAYADGDRILSGIDLTVPKGSTLGVVGPTGAGKSTFLDLLMGLLVPTEGTISVDGLSITDNVRAWQMSLGVVPQSPFLLDDTLRRNIALGLDEREIDESRIAEALQLAQLEPFVSTLPNGIHTELGEHGVRLSGGQRQRVAIARALYRDPDVLILDEATSALDRVTEKDFMQDLAEKKPGCTMVVVSHRVGALTECHQIALLEDGRLVAKGSFDELRDTSPLFREMAS